MLDSANSYGVTHIHLYQAVFRLCIAKYMGKWRCPFGTEQTLGLWTYGLQTR